MRNYMMQGQMEKPCDCVQNKPCMKYDEFPPAMAYVPWQNLGTVYEMDKALEVGTIFPELNKPFSPKRGMCR